MQGGIIMFKMFNLTRQAINQKQFVRSFTNKTPVHENKLPEVDKNLSRINTAMMCDEPEDYETAMIRGWALLDSPERRTGAALHSFEKALEFNPNSLSAHMFKLLICNELGLTEKGKDGVKQLKQNMPSYLDLILQMEKSLAQITEVNKQNTLDNKKILSPKFKSEPISSEKLPCSSSSDFCSMPAYK